MQLLQDGIVAALAAVGLTTLVWLTVGALRNPRKRTWSDAVVILPARGAADGLEYSVHALEQQRYNCGGFTRIVILDCGMDDDARAVADILCREGYHTELCRAEDLSEKFT